MTPGSGVSQLTPRPPPIGVGVNCRQPARGQEGLTDPPMSATAREFLAERRNWLKIAAVPGHRGDGGQDVAVIIDGTYTNAHGPVDDIVAYWAERLADVLDRERIEIRR
jgi:hypothetical protein